MNHPATALVVMLLLAAGAAGQPALPPPGADSATVRGDTPRTRKRLAEIEQQILTGKTADATDELQRVLDESGDDLIAVDAHRFVPARRYAHRFLAQLPAPTLSAYRDRIDGPAGKLLEQGRAARDPEPLRRLLNQYFVSRPTEDALLLLGELAFERGEFRAAETYWRRLTPDANPDEFPYPGPQTDPAAVRAKVALAVIFQGELTRADELLAVIRDKHPEAAGRLAGRTGIYADTLTGLIAAPPRLPPDGTGDQTWTTFGGRPTRDGRVDGRLPFRWPNRPTWATPIPRDPAAARDRYPAKPPPVGAVRSVAFHPVVVGDSAYLADAGRVFAFDLATGQARQVYDIRKEDPSSQPPGDLKLPLRFDADFALSASGTALYARLGSAGVFPEAGGNQPPPKRQSYLVCLDVTGDAARVRWAKSPPVGENATAAWEGAPVVADGRVIAAFARSDGGRVIHALACYDESGRRLLWTAELSEGGGPGGENRHRHELLTRAGPNVVFCSHAGAVVATDIRTGKPAWAYRYPRAKKVPGESRYRDANPPVAAGGRVFVAPTDAEYLLALDADTGRLLWDAGPIAVDQVVGAAGGKVICTIAAPVRGVRGFDAATGSTSPPYGWAQHDDPGLASFGRGLVSDDVVVWPTHAGLFTLRTRDGMPARQPIPGPHGNLAFANGVLLCATPTELWGYVSPSHVRPGGGAKEGGKRWANHTDAPALPPDEVLTRVQEELAGLASPRPQTPGGARPDLNIPVTISEAPAIQTSPTEPVPGDGRQLSPILRTDTRTIARVGESHLVAVGRDNREVTWVLDGLKRRQFDPYAAWPGRRFLAPVYADDTHVVAFTSGGRRWVIDAASGHVLHDQPGPAPEFVSPPVRVGDVLVLVATGPSSVAAFEPATGRTAWEFDAGRAASLTGTAPRMWAAADAVFVAVGRNIGLEIDCLRPADGGRRWRAGPAFIPALEIDTSATAMDDDRLYVPYADRLAAVRLDTGRTAWEYTLPALADSAGWVALAAGNAVVALPAAAVPSEPFARAAGRVGRSFASAPHVRRLPGLAATLYDAWVDRTVPVLLLDPATGRLLQRLDLPARGPAAAAHLSAGGLTVATGGATYRLK